jgi:hypothetical protein
MLAANVGIHLQLIARFHSEFESLFKAISEPVP